MSEAPELFLDPASLAALRRKLRTAQGRKLYRIVSANAQRWLKRPPMGPPPFPSTDSDRSPAELLRSRTGQNGLLHLALMYKITGEKRYLERCWQELECWLLRWQSWCDPFHGDKNFFDLMTGELGLGLALAYDWLKADLSPGRRALLSTQIQRRVLDCYRLNILDLPKGRQAAWWHHCEHNWNPVCHGGALVAALALRDEYPQWRHIVNEAKRCMDPYFAKMARSEASEEGTGYWQYGMRYGFFALEALRCAKIPGGPWLRSKGLERSCYAPIEFAPGLKPISWGDASTLVRSSMMYLLAARFKNPDLLEYADLACVDYARRPDTKEGIQDWDDLPLGLLWRPEKLAPRKRGPFHPARAGTCAYPKIGWACYFDSWRKPQLVAGIKCGDLGANHTQLDNFSYQIQVRGEDLAEDLGTGTYNRAYFSEARWSMYKVSTAGHNSLLINGQGQRPHTLGTLKPVPAAPGLEGARCDASRCYGPGVRRAQRHFLLLDKRRILILDDVLLAQPGSIEWRCHAFKPTRARGGQARIQGQRGALSLYAPGRHFQLRHKIVPMAFSGAESVTKKPVPRRENLLVLKAGGAKRLLLPVLMHSGAASAAAPKLRSASLAWHGKTLRFEADLGKAGHLALAWTDGEHGLELQRGSAHA